jgi:CRP/FNR family transcriptional regulator
MMLAQNLRSAFVGDDWPSITKTYRNPASRPATDAPGSSITILHQFGVKRYFLRDDVIFDAQQSTDRVIRVLSGTLRLCKHIAGRRRIVDFLQPGDLYGITGSPQFSVEAVTDAVVTAYPRRQLHELIAASPYIGLTMVSQLAESLAAVQSQLLSFGCANAKMQMAAFLLRLCARQGVVEGGRIELAMSRRDVADHLGLSVETACRALSTLQSEAMIRIPDRRHIPIANMRALSDLATIGPVEI